MNITEYRESATERERTMDILHLTPGCGGVALDVGARDGHFSRLLTDKYETVVALDLEKPSFSHPKIICEKGDVTGLHFEDNSFDFVLCAEVLEHIPPQLLEKACMELGRVTKGFLLIGVPYRQDTRVGRTTCYSCHRKNPPWGHVNTFDEKRLQGLFPNFEASRVSFVGETDSSTNFFSAYLMDLAGNPYGTYYQQEPCIYCGEKLKTPPERDAVQKVLTKAAFYLRSTTRLFSKPHPNWIHILFKKHMP